MTPHITKLIDPTRDDLVHAIRHAMLFHGRRRTYPSDYMDATVAAETVIDGLALANYVILRRQPGELKEVADREIEEAVKLLEASYE